jgi:hypothetical protein
MQGTQPQRPWQLYDDAYSCPKRHGRRRKAVATIRIIKVSPLRLAATATLIAHSRYASGRAAEQVSASSGNGQSLDNLSDCTEPKRLRGDSGGSLPFMSTSLSQIGLLDNTAPRCVALPCWAPYMRLAPRTSAILDEPLLLDIVLSLESLL